MPEIEKFYHNEENLGKECIFWDLKGRFSAVTFPEYKWREEPVVRA